ncbi:hypothetical protein [Plantactinospora sp. DSM 117369]
MAGAQADGGCRPGGLPLLAGPGLVKLPSAVLPPQDGLRAGSAGSTAGAA